MAQERLIRDWFKELPEPLRTQCFRNLLGETMDDTATSMVDALAAAFRWDKTVEGKDYWQEIHNRLKEEFPRTVRDLLEDFPEPYRTQALANCRFLDLVAHTHSDAIHCFEWHKSPEGFAYWEAFFYDLDYAGL